MRGEQSLTNKVNMSSWLCKHSSQDRRATTHTFVLNSGSTGWSNRDVFICCDSFSCQNVSWYPSFCSNKMPLQHVDFLLHFPFPRHSHSLTHTHTPGNSFPTINLWEAALMPQTSHRLTKANPFCPCIDHQISPFMILLPGPPVHLASLGFGIVMCFLNRRIILNHFT